MQNIIGINDNQDAAVYPYEITLDGEVIARFATQAFRDQVAMTLLELSYNIDPGTMDCNAYKTVESLAGPTNVRLAHGDNVREMLAEAIDAVMETLTYYEHVTPQ